MPLAPAPPPHRLRYHGPQQPSSYGRPSDHSQYQAAYGRPCVYYYLASYFYFYVVHVPATYLYPLQGPY